MKHEDFPIDINIAKEFIKDNLWEIASELSGDVNKQ